MGQKSQIFVRYSERDNKKKLVARYYGWNYGDRMISRARHSIDWLKACGKYLTEYKAKIPRIIDTNFDMVDVIISVDILQEYMDDSTMYIHDVTEEIPTLNQYLFEMQNNDDGKLLLDVLPDETVKYAFLDSTNKLLTPEQYMEWDEDKNWKIPDEIRNEDVIKKTITNIDAIKQNSIQMTADEVEEFLTADYSYSLANYSGTF